MCMYSSSRQHSEGSEAFGPCGGFVAHTRGSGMRGERRGILTSHSKRCSSNYNVLRHVYLVRRASLRRSKLPLTARGGPLHETDVVSHSPHISHPARKVRHPASASWPGGEEVSIEEARYKELHGGIPTHGGSSSRHTQVHTR